MDIKIFKENEKLDEVYKRICDYINKIVKEDQLSYIEIFGVLKCINTDIVKNNIEEIE